MRTIKNIIASIRIIVGTPFIVVAIVVLPGDFLKNVANRMAHVANALDKK